jgi:hypothetical protein
MMMMKNEIESVGWRLEHSSQSFDLLIENRAKIVARQAGIYFQEDDCIMLQQVVIQEWSKPL